ncbi:sulfur carrier protein ThiS [Geoalkalibacter sp.]|uniref:sulfur carrier protein ThiS n=1 Tax=Geoalkalibacter sp. TaxID=3041440 RepID=UPI00272EBBC1|nr:sulfur carrier protein ThiS [Geoalkalibacter sp.]
MKIKINGEPRDLSPPLTVAEYLATLGLEVERVAVEHNHRILPRENFAEAQLADGDTLEIIQFVGGG